MEQFFVKGYHNGDRAFYFNHDAMAIHIDSDPQYWNTDAISGYYDSETGLIRVNPPDGHWVIIHLNKEVVIHFEDLTPVPVIPKELEEGCDDNGNITVGFTWADGLYVVNADTSMRNPI